MWAIRTLIPGHVLGKDGTERFDLFSDLFDITTITIDSRSCGMYVRVRRDTSSGVVFFHATEESLNVLRKFRSKFLIRIR